MYDKLAQSYSISMWTMDMDARTTCNPNYAKFSRKTSLKQPKWEAKPIELYRPSLTAQPSTLPSLWRR